MLNIDHVFPFSLGQGLVQKYMGLINKVDMVCLSPVGYGVWLTFS